MGICKLTIKNPQKHHMAKYHCRIAGREKEKNCFTKTEFVLKGTIGMVNLIPFYKKKNYFSFFNFACLKYYQSNTSAWMNKILTFLLIFFTNQVRFEH